MTNPERRRITHRTTLEITGGVTIADLERFCDAIRYDGGNDDSIVKYSTINTPLATKQNLTFDRPANGENE